MTKFFNVELGRMLPVCDDVYRDHVTEMNSRIMRCDGSEWHELKQDPLSLTEQEIGKFRVWWQFRNLAQTIKTFFPNGGCFLHEHLNEVEEDMKNQIFTMKMYHYVTGDE